METTDPAYVLRAVDITDTRKIPPKLGEKSANPCSTRARPQNRTHHTKMGRQDPPSGMNRHVLWRRRAPLDSEGLGSRILEALPGNLAVPWFRVLRLGFSGLKPLQVASTVRGFEADWIESWLQVGPGTMLKALPHVEKVCRNQLPINPKP